MILYKLDILEVFGILLHTMGIRIIMNSREDVLHFLYYTDMFNRSSLENGQLERSLERVLALSRRQRLSDAWTWQKDRSHACHRGFFIPPSWFRARCPPTAFSFRPSGHSNYSGTFQCGYHHLDNSFKINTSLFTLFLNLPKRSSFL